MRAPIETLRQNILSMLAPASTADVDAIAALTEADWIAINRMVKQHRLGPMLHDRDKSLGESWPLPDNIRASWREQSRRAGFRALKFERTLRSVASLMASEQIEFVALKGAWLAWHAYPHPAMRPMRDLDLLVPPERALSVYHLLLAKGYAPTGATTEPPEEALRRRKHLPSIRSTDTDVVLEIHTRLSDVTGSPDLDAAADADRDEQLMHKMKGMIGDHPIHYLSPTDTLLHLIVHSAYDHRMNNGPAVFADVAYLIQSHPVDWDRFWTRAHLQGWTAGCELLLTLAMRNYGAMPIQWPNGHAPEIPEDILSSAMLLSLQEHDQRNVVSLMGKAAMGMNSGSGAKGLLARLYAPRHQMAALVGLEPRNPMAFLAYPIWLVNAAMPAAKGLFRAAARDDTAKYAALSHWLGTTSIPHEH